MVDAVRDRWLKSLPESVQKMLEMSPAQMNDFSDNVRIADFLAKLAFKRVVDGLEHNDKIAAKRNVVEIGDSPFNIDTEAIADNEINARMALALKANQSSAELKEQRITLIDKYENVNDIPVPLNIKFHVVESTPEQQKARLKALGRYKEEEEVEEA